MVLLEVLDIIHHEKNCEKLIKNMKEIVRENIENKSYKISRTFMIENVDFGRCKDYKGFRDFSSSMNILIRRGSYSDSYNISYDKKRGELDIK